MAGLDGTITIGIDYRPCIVHIPREVSQQVGISDGGVRYGPFKLENEERTIKALFHTWNPVNGNGVVEYDNGAVEEVEPCWIRFVDGRIKEHGFSFEGVADVNIACKPTVQEAIQIVRDELLKRGDLYRAFSASIYSGLNDMPENTWIDEMPELILKRIIGED